MNEIEDGIYLHKLFDIAYLVKGDKVMIQNPENDTGNQAEWIGDICKCFLIMA